MKKFIFATINLISFQIFALSQSECTTVNILNGPNVTSEVRAHFNTPFNQYGTQLCYAHAAADILTVIAGRSISPVAMAVLSAEGDFDSDSAGEIPNVLSYVNRSQSACTNAGFNSRMTEAQYQQLPSQINCTGPNLARINNPIKIKFYRDCLSGQTPRRVLPESYKDTILNAIYEEISTHSHPVGLTIYSSLLMPVKDGQTAEPGGAHAITVIGRKWNIERQTCDLVIRNSYGNETCGDWDQNKQGITCNSESIGNGFPSSGILAMSEALFKQVLHRITIINHDVRAEEVSTITPPNFCQPAADVPTAASPPAK